MAAGSFSARMDPSNAATRTERKERTMDSENRFQQVTFHQQQLRNEAAAERLARGNQDRFRSPSPALRIPKTLGVWRRLVGSTSA